jgi:hypothetical protein
MKYFAKKAKRGYKTQNNAWKLSEKTSGTRGYYKNKSIFQPTLPLRRGEKFNS